MTSQELLLIWHTAQAFVVFFTTLHWELTGVAIAHVSQGMVNTKQHSMPCLTYPMYTLTKTWFTACIIKQRSSSESVFNSAVTRQQWCNFQHEVLPSGQFLIVLFDISLVFNFGAYWIEKKKKTVFNNQYPTLHASLWIFKEWDCHSYLPYNWPFGSCLSPAYNVFHHT